MLYILLISQFLPYTQYRTGIYTIQFVYGSLRHTVLTGNGGYRFALAHLVVFGLGALDHHLAALGIVVSGAGLVICVELSCCLLVGKIKE